MALSFISNLIRKSLSLEIENYIWFVNATNSNKLSTFTKSAFVQCRKKINPKVFDYLSSVIIDEFYTDNDLSVKLWKGFRLLAVDGSTLTLPQTKELEKIYGLAKNQTTTGVVKARISVLYDVLNNYVLDGQISPLKTGEIQLAKKHLKVTKEKDLIIYDRGYPSFDLVFEHLNLNRDFLMRVKIGFNIIVKDFVASNKKSKIVEIKPRKGFDFSTKQYNKNTTIKVRLILVILKDGSKEVLMTSLLNSKTYSTKTFKELYLKRWQVETFYDELKNKMKVEKFSGYSNQTILQDFSACLFVSNIQTLIVSEITDEINKNKQHRTKYKYKVNNNLSYGFLKNRIIDLFQTDKDIEIINQELKELFKRHIIPIRPNRSIPRNKEKFRRRRLFKVTKNQRDTI